MAGVAHGRDDDGVVLVLLELVPLDLGHGVEDVGAREHAVSAVHVGEGQRGVVGDDHAVAAPLAAQHARDHALVGAVPVAAHTAVGGHHAVAGALGEGVLEAAQVDLTDGLLVGPGRDAAAVGFLVVQSEVLDQDVGALGLDALALGREELAGEEAVLGEVLEVAAAVGVAVDVGAGAVEIRDVGCDAVVADHAAHVGEQVGVEGRAHDVLGGQAHGLDVGLGAEERGGEAGRAVLVAGSGELDGLDGLGVVEGRADEEAHVGGRELVEQVVPLLVVVVEAEQVDELQAVLGTGDGHGGIGVLAVVEALRVA